jgi:Ca2+-binding EF-hand superfamily protein
MVLMITRRVAVLGCMAGAVLAVWTLPLRAAAKRSHAMQLLDPDNNGTVDFEEAKKAAAALFDHLDRNHNGGLNKRELGGRVTPQEFAAADAGKNGKLSKSEYLSVVEKRFKAADPDGNGKLGENELSSRAGRALFRLLLQ